VLDNVVVTDELAAFLSHSSASPADQGSERSCNRSAGSPMPFSAATVMIGSCAWQYTWNIV